MISYSAVLLGFQLGLAMAMPFPYGPAVINPYYPGVPMTMPVYSIAKPLLYQKGMMGDAGYYGGNEGFNGYANDLAGHDVVRDNNQVVKQGAQGVNGNHVVVKGSEGGQGYQSNVAGANYNHGGDAFTAGQKAVDVSAKDGYGGFGNRGHRKGHKTTGFHKTYHNVESGKDSKFVDEDHDVAEENFGKNFDNRYDNSAWDQYNHGRRGGEFGEHVVNNAGGGSGMKSVGVHEANFDARDHNRFTNNRDLAYQRANMEANRNKNLGMGHSAGHGGASGSYFVGPHIG